MTDHEKATDQELQTAWRQEEVERERTLSPEAQRSGEAMNVDTAYVVFVQNGEAFATGSLGDVWVQVKGRPLRLHPLRQAGLTDMHRYSLEVAKDVEVSETASEVVRQIVEHAEFIDKMRGRDAGVHDDRG